MIRRVWQWVFFTVLVCSLALASLFLFDAQVADYYFNLLEPWRDLCAYITPEKWQIQGNILLGLMWLFSGVVVCAAVISMVCVILLAFTEKLCKRISRNKVTGKVVR